jgi:hypothetical protein
MQGLLGKIVSVQDDGEAGPDGRRYKVAFKPVAILLSRAKPPDWIKDQTLTVVRTTPDPREIGRAGDSLVLGGDEAGTWLRPLAVSPDVANGALPAALDIRLGWWKDDSPPEYRATANGITLSGKFDGDAASGFHTAVDTSAFGPAVRLPLTVDIECDALRASCVVMPASPAAVRRQTPLGQRYYAANDWYALDLVLGMRAGCIAGLVERGRGLDHFLPASHNIAYHADAHGQFDRYRTSWMWNDGVHGVAVQSSGHRREGSAVRVSLDALADEGMGLRTTGNYTLFDDLPLLVTQREYFRGKPKDDKAPDVPREPIDTLLAFAMGFRSGTAAERNGDRGSRVMASTADRLVTHRSTGQNEGAGNQLRLDDGWVMIEHPGRRSYLLYLTDTDTPASFAIWTGINEIAVEPHWPHTILAQEQSAGFATGLAAGETGAASEAGAWIGVRGQATADGRERCAVIARLRDPGPATAAITLGAQTQEVALETLHAPGIGPVRYAVATFDRAPNDARLTAVVAGMKGK